ncbi:MAG TPA: hypothetical protein VI007_02885 [bacterium]
MGQPRVRGTLIIIAGFVLLFGTSMGRAGQAPQPVSNAVTVGELAPWFTPLVVPVGAVPIQSPFSPDGKWVVVANTGSSSASIIAVDQANPANIRVVGEAKASKGEGYLRLSYNWGGPAEDIGHDIRRLLGE